MVKLVFVRQAAAREPPTGRPGKGVADMVVQIGHQNPKYVLKLRNAVAFNQKNGQDSRPAGRNEVVDRVVMLGRERCVHLVLVVDLVIPIKPWIGMHHFVRGVKAKLVDKDHQQNVPNVLGGGRPMLVRGLEEKGLVQLENFPFHVNLARRQHRQQNAHVQGRQLQGLFGELPKVGSNLGVWVEPGPRGVLLDFVLLKEREVALVNGDHHQRINDKKHRSNARGKDKFGNALAVSGMGRYKSSKDLVPDVLATEKGESKHK